MRQIIHTLISYPALFVLENSIKRFTFFAGLIIIALSLFYLNKYIDARSLIPGFSNFYDNNESELAEDLTKVITIKKGDTLGAILKNQGLPSKDISQIIKLSQAEDINSKLKIGQTITFEYSIELIEKDNSDLNKEQHILNRVLLSIDKINSIEFVRTNENFITNHISAPLNKLVSKYETNVDSNVITSLKKVGMSTNSIIKLINAYSHQIDFQRQIQSGDKITVITEKFVTSDNKFSHHGKIIYASIKTKNNDYKIYHYSPNDSAGSHEFFSEDGKSIKSTLLRTPVKVARISSHYGYRKKHPVHGYGAHHKGVDFAAAPGTPIYAAGDGVVTFIGWKAGYGRLILLKHNNDLSTAYAHASKFTNHLKKGSKVKQSDVIAYVGESGHTTGPHLHFEVRIKNKPVNPMEFKSTPGIQLVGEKLKKFNKFKTHIGRLSTKLNDATELVASDIKEISLF